MGCERAVCLNCMDGRVQLPVIAWIKNKTGAQCVDMVTEPGMDGLLAAADRPIEDIVKKVNISIKVNNASVIFIVAHHDCRGNPVAEDVHVAQLKAGVKRLKVDFPDYEVKGLWVDHHWNVNPLL